MNSSLSNSRSNSRPHFFTGQPIDYRDFNRLSTRTDELVSQVLSQLYPEGGIVNAPQGNGEPFEIKIYENSHDGNQKLMIELGSGFGILPNGQILCLQESKLLDLAPYTIDKKSKVLIAYARNVVRADQHYVDPDDNTLTGYKTESFEPEIFFSTEAPRQDPLIALELFRIRFSETASRLRLMTSEEDWQSDADLASLLEAAPGVALVDLRFRKLLCPTLADPNGTSRTLQLRKSLTAMKRSLSKLSRIYLVPDLFNTELYISSLQAEILSQPYQPMKASFLTSEVAEKLSMYLENLTIKTGASRSDFSRDLAMQAIQVIEPARTNSVRSMSPNFDALLQADAKLQEMVKYSESNFSLTGTVREALSVLRDQPIDLHDKISVAGRVFEKVDQVDLTQKKRWHSVPADHDLRTVSAAFKESKEGMDLTLSGAFIRNGHFVSLFEVKYANRPLLLFLNQYIRRAGTAVQYELNGKKLDSGKSSDLSIENCWINEGLVIPADFLVTGENQLSIQLEKNDLDFGFFGLAAYQPAISEVIEWT